MTFFSSLSEKNQSRLRTTGIWLGLGVIWFTCMMLFSVYGGCIAGDDGINRIKMVQERRMQRAKNLLGSGFTVEEAPAAKPAPEAEPAPAKDK